MILLRILSVALFLSGCAKQVSEKDLLNKKDPIGSYGQTVSKTNQLSIYELISSADKYLGKNVVVNAQIDDVCPMRGCWMNIFDEKTSASLRVKVTDGDIVFPLSGIGNNVVAEGIFTKLNLTEDQARNWKVHLAEEKGITLDLDSIMLAPEDYYEYRIACLGAEIF